MWAQGGGDKVWEETMDVFIGGNSVDSGLGDEGEEGLAFVTFDDISPDFLSWATKFSCINE